MIYRKNITSLEQVIRVISGPVMICLGLLVYIPQPWGYVVAALGLSTLVTGVFGWCPGCAMMGRKLK